MNPSPNTSIELRTSDGASCLILPQRGGLIRSWTVPIAGQPREMLWTPPSLPQTGWPDGGIPFLFPFAGRVWLEAEVGRYRIENFVGKMGLHGFLYDREMHLVSSTKSTAVLRRIFGDEDTEIFPFNYQVDLRIDLADSELKMAATISHKPGTSTTGQGRRMPVAAGIHPFWKLHNADASQSRFQLPASVIHDVVDGRAGAGEKIAPDYAFFLKDERLRSRIFSNLTANHSRLNLNPGQTITTKWSPARAGRTHVLWSNLKDGYFCSEPWMAFPDAVHHGDGLVWLNAGEELTVEYSFKVS